MQLLPAIVAHAKYAFRNLRGEAKQDAIQEVIANALVAFVALVRRGKMSCAYSTPLAKYAVAQIKDGRRVGNRLRISEVLSRYAQQHKRFSVSRLDKFDEEANAWEEILIEDKTAGPAQTAMTRIDFEAWLQSLPRRDRKVAEYLSLGNRTADAARKFGLSQGRISQLRRALAQSWQDHTGGNEANAA
jgi:hypothetical protein